MRRFDQFDPVAIGVLDEGDDIAPPVRRGMRHRARRAQNPDAHLFETGRGGVDIRDGEGDMAERRAVVVAGNAMVMSQLDHGMGSFIPEPEEYQRELSLREFLAPQLLEAKRIAIEGEGTLEIADTDHGMREMVRAIRRRGIEVHMLFLRVG